MGEGMGQFPHNEQHITNAGNEYAKKLDTPEIRQEAYRQYCDHIARGQPKNAWFFDHPHVTLTCETMEKYIRNYPEEFDADQKKIAEAKSLAHWFGVLADSAKGNNRYANPASLQMIMRNKFGWDRNNDRRDDNTEIAIAHDRLMKQIKSMQSPQAALEQKESELRSESNPPEYTEQKEHVQEDVHHF